MLRNSFTWLLLFVFSTALAACCGSVACVCDDNVDDALFFRFALDTATTNPNPTGFRPNDLDTVYIQRVPLDTAQRPRADTVVILGGRLGFVPTLVINNASPFPQSGTRKLDQYTYKILLASRRQRSNPRYREIKSFSVTNIKVEDEFISKSCCTCNNNIQKDLTLDGQPRSLADPGGDDKGIEVVLTR
jgi:hypothetical protein